MIRAKPDVQTGVPVPGDFDRDGKTDIAVFRPATGEWHVIRSGSNTSFAYQWGNANDVPILKRP